MTRYIAVFVVLVSAAAVFSGPSYNIGIYLGGTASSVEASKMPTGISVNDSKWKGYVTFGVNGEAMLNEYFGAGIGVAYEKRGGVLAGSFSWGAWTLFTGEFEYDYTYLQIPIYLKAMIPLMIPGGVFITLGPEMGIKLESEFTVRNNTLNVSSVDKSDSLATAVDFGLSGTVGYDLPISWWGGVRLFGGFYYGFLDAYENKTTGTSDQNIFHRAFKYGLSLYVNINAARR